MRRNDEFNDQGMIRDELFSVDINDAQLSI